MNKSEAFCFEVSEVIGQGSQMPDHEPGTGETLFYTVSKSRTVTLKSLGKGSGFESGMATPIKSAGCHFLRTSVVPTAE